MAITLAEAKLQSTDRIVQAVIDAFRKSSYLMDTLIFDDTVTPGGGGSLVYGYNYVLTQTGAAVRALNADYTPGNAVIDRKTVTLVPLGGKYPIDRVVAASNGLVDRVAFETEQKVKATSALMSDLVVNGSDETDFDGIDASCADANVISGTTIDLTTSANMDTNKNLAIDALNQALSLVPGANAILTGRMGRLKMMSIARRLGYMSVSEDAFGRPVETFAGIPIVDLGAKAGSTDPIVRETDGGATPVSLTDIYVVRLGLDGVHAATLAGLPMINIITPNTSLADAVLYGAVEMVAAAVVRQQDAIAKIEGILI
jgi:hypothetical protein